MVEGGGGENVHLVFIYFYSSIRCLHHQVLKFGRVVDLEQVERLTGNKAADELKTALALKENDR